MISLLKERRYPRKPATQPGVDGPTADGFLVPISDIEPKAILKSSVFPWDDYSGEMTLVEKGQAAVLVVRAAIINNRFPLWVCGIVTTDRELDIEGTDIVVNAMRRVQVKHDWGSCSVEQGGTGNLYVQTHERNPLHLH